MTAPTPGEPFVPDGFPVPTRLDGELDGLPVTLLPLTPEHNEADHAAWSSSMEHIHSTPGFEGHPWPLPLSLAQNLADLEGHAEDFRLRRGFTYTVLSAGRTIGCLYIYPADTPGGAKVRSWVTAERAALDAPLYAWLRDWLETDWPFSRFSYAPRTD